MQAQVGAEFIRTTTGWPLQAALPLQHIGWLRDNCPPLHAGARHYLFVNDFIGWRLTGRLCMNPSDASITQLMNLATGDWDERLLETAGIRRDQLAPIRPSGAAIGALTAEAAEATGLPRDTLVVNGAHDQYCAAVGTDVTQPGRMPLRKPACSPNLCASTPSMRLTRVTRRWHRCRKSAKTANPVLNDGFLVWCGEHWINALRNRGDGGPTAWVSLFHPR